MKLLAAVIGTLVFAGTANAVPPAFNSVSQQNRHPTASFYAPRAGSVTITLASKPDRGTDGSFLRENVEDIDFFTDSEIQTGSWLYERQIDPGTYYTMLEATPEPGCTTFPPPTFTRAVDPGCSDGFSAVVALVIPKPASRYSVTVRRYTFLRQFTLTLAARPLGETRPYRVCYRLKSKRRVCLRGTLNGFDWNDRAEDDLTISTRKLAVLTTFTWYAGNRKVASRTIRR